jgi:oxepin-CoA hydrolase/3-oxo-5,6-dehydrosuberyl-CoA semialdehyde dehydrogenase
MSLKTHKRTVTDSDIINFANLTWDHFYAHTDITSLEGSIFEKRAAHGYFILAAAAGLFVYPNKGPVAANYGLEECRFVRPVYHNDTLYVRLTCKEKVERDSKGKEFPSGVVKWFVEVFDQNDELVAVATILTLVQKKSPFFPFEKAAVMGALGRLNPDTQAKWGMMTPQHMVEHLVFHFRTAMGQIQMDIVTPEDRIEKWQDSLWNYIAMPENYKHPKMDPEKLMPLEFNSLPEAMMALSTTWDEYLAYFKANPEARNNNAVFGSLDKVQWDLLGRKHFHHHLRQFGLV